MCTLQKYRSSSSTSNSATVLSIPLPLKDKNLMSESLDLSVVGRVTALADYPSLGLQVALENSLETGNFIDTKLYAFSRRRNGRLIDKPLPVYANSALLQARSAYFGRYFRESTLTSLRVEFPKDRDGFIVDYDYDSDSDLDEFECSDPDHADSEAPTLTLPHNGVNTGSCKQQLTYAGEQQGCIIVIPDVAFTTLKAIIYYFYTGRINFAPSRDSASSESQPQPQTQDTWKGPICSPKSMYRLADRLELPELKEQAKASIASRITPRTVVRELRSYISLKYEDVREMILDIACNPTNRYGLLAVMRVWLRHLATGDIQNEANILVTIFERVAALPPTTSTAQVVDNYSAPSTTPVTSPPSASPTVRTDRSTYDIAQDTPV